MELLIGGQWTAAQSGRQEDVTSPFDGAVVGSVPVAGVGRRRRRTDRGHRGARRCGGSTPAHERMRILLQAAALADERAEAIAQTISAEAGKTHHRGTRRGVAVR